MHWKTAQLQLITVEIFGLKATPSQSYWRQGTTDNITPNKRNSTESIGLTPRPCATTDTSFVARKHTSLATAYKADVTT